MQSLTKGLGHFIWKTGKHKTYFQHKAAAHLAGLKNCREEKGAVAKKNWRGKASGQTQKAVSEGKETVQSGKSQLKRGSKTHPPEDAPFPGPQFQMG